MRYAIPMTILVCAACAALGDFAAWGDRDSAANGIVMQPATSAAELDAACAAHRCADQPKPQPQISPPPPVAAIDETFACARPCDELDPDASCGR